MSENGIGSVSQNSSVTPDLNEQQELTEPSNDQRATDSVPTQPLLLTPDFPLPPNNEANFTHARLP